jgi:hypothetical protein
LQRGAHGGDHLVDRGIAFDREGVLHPHAARLGHARQVVAQEVDDHQVFGAVLGRSGEFGGKRGVLWPVAPARASALHRLDRGRRPALGEEQFGREAQQPVRAIVDHAAIAGPRRRTDRGIKRQRIAAIGCRQRKGEVGLVDVARRIASCMAAKAAA